LATALDFIGEEIEPLADTGEGTGEVEAGVTAGDGVEEVDGKAQPGRDSWCGAAKPEGEGDGEGEREGEGKGDAEEAAEDGREDSSDERGDVRRVCAASCFFCGMGIGEVGGDFTVDGTTFKSRAGTGDVFSDVGGSGGGVEGGGGRELHGLSRGKSKKKKKKLHTEREQKEKYTQDQSRFASVAGGAVWLRGARRALWRPSPESPLSACGQRQPLFFFSVLCRVYATEGVKNTLRGSPRRIMDPSPAGQSRWAWILHRK
jgi:hypothetical protein